MNASIELTHLRYFVTVAEELHFGRAAEKLAISQPPLTQQIQRLEQRIGFALFERSTRKTGLTDAGAALLPMARAALEQVERAVASAQAAGRGEAGKLVIATPPSVMLGGLPRVIRWFRKSMPKVELSLREMATAGIADALRAGTADVGFLRCEVAPEGVREWHRYREGVAVILSRQHRLAEARRIRLQALERDPFVFFPRRLGSNFYDELLNICRRAGFEPRIVQEATQWPTVVALVEAGMGVTIAPAPVARLAARKCVARLLPEVNTSIVVASGLQQLRGVVSRFVEACTRRL